MKIKLVLDINKNLQAQLNAVVTGRQGDKVSNTVNVFVVDGGIPYNLTGNTIFYEGLKPNDAYVRDSSGVKMINATQGNFEYTFRPETFGVAGIGKRSYFSIEQGGTVRASTQDFGLVTLADAMTGNTMSGPYISELEELINLAQWLVDDINSRWTSINTQLTQLQNKLNGMDVVKRSGDTMTGNLNFQTKDGAKMLQWYNDQTQLGRLVFHPSGLVEWFGRNGATETGAWNYSPATNTFNVVSNTNLAKKTDFYMDYLQANGNTKSFGTSDLNTLKTPGSYGGNGAGVTGVPLSGSYFWYVEVTSYSDTKYVKQEATTLSGGTIALTFTRRMVNNVWEPWVESIGSTGGTMTGTLHMQNSTVNWENSFLNNGGRRTRMFMDNTNGTAFTIVTEKTAGAGDWDYSGHLRVGDRRNWMKNDTDTMTGHLNLSSNSQINYNQLTNTSSAKGMMFTDDASLAVVGGIGRFRDATRDYTYMGWGTQPWLVANNLTVSSSQLTYKNFAITTAEKDTIITLPLNAEAVSDDVNFPFRAVRRGNSVTITGKIMLKADATGNTVTGLPVDVRPAVRCSTHMTASDGTVVFIDFQTNGIVTINNAGKGKAVYMTVTFTVN